ncbi:MAG TPA: AAA family ATPase [Terracidiphilus sp.]|nr:AAA family ATPase [Terracidiphilus sp.]
MKRYILTGAPGAGKTAVLRQLELDGFSVVEEAATDVIALLQVRGAAEPWKDVSFIDAIAELQMQRQLQTASEPGNVQFHDRSAICTAALAEYLGFPQTERLTRELERIKHESIFERQVFFLRNLGFVAPTEARRISFEDALRFERIHEETYCRFGFQIIWVEPGSIEERANMIKAAVTARI